MCNLDPGIWETCEYYKLKQVHVKLNFNLVYDGQQHLCTVGIRERSFFMKGVGEAGGIWEAPFKNT